MIKLSQQTISNPNTSTSIDIPVWLSEQPSATVTVTPTSDNGDFTVSSALTFTTSNWATPQTVTCTRGSWTGANPVRLDSLILTPSGGGETEVVSQKILFQDGSGDIPSPDEFISGRYDLWNFCATSDVDGAIEYLWKGAGLPTAAPDTINTGYTSVFHDGEYADLTSVSSCTELVFTEKDVDDYDVIRKFYLCETNQTWNGKIIIGHQGNGDVGRTANLGEVGLGFGYHYVEASMLFQGRNTLSTNPRLTPTGSAAMRNKFGYDNSMGDFDDENNIALRHWVSHNCRLVQYLIDTYSVTVDDIIIEGTSGGTFDAIFLGWIMGLGTTVQNRGGDVAPVLWENSSGNSYQTGYNRVTGVVPQNSTDEVKEFYENNLQISSGSVISLLERGKTVVFMTNTGDTASLNEVHNYLFKAFLDAKSIGDNYHVLIDEDAGNTTHSFSSDDSDKLFTLLGDI